MADSTSGYSQQDPDDSASDFRALQFQIDRTLARVRTIVLVKVIAVGGGAGAIAAPGTVNVLPLTKIVDGQNNVSSHGTVFNVPVFRVMSKWGALIVDPVVGDIGWMAVSDRDISVVKSTKGKESQPGSRRKFSMSDGVYIGGLFGDAPTQYLRFTEHGIDVKSGNDGIALNGLKIKADGSIDGDLTVAGTVFAGTDVQAKTGAAKVTLIGHEHAGNNQPPIAGH
jgi:hypothetical protein